MSDKVADLVDKLEEVVKAMGTLILVVKAKGGYRFRVQIRRTDAEVTVLSSACETLLTDYAIRCTVAEHMLRELPPSYHARWDEYQGRLKECLKELAESQRKPK